MERASLGDLDSSPGSTASGRSLFSSWVEEKKKHYTCIPQAIMIG